MVTVGIDPHKKTHTAVCVGCDGRRRGRVLTVADDPAAVETVLAWARQAAAGEPIRWAIEDGRGLARRLAVALVVAGCDVVWVPVRLMAGARRGGPARGKSDPIDATAVARAAANPDNAGYLAPVSLTEPGRELGHLLDERRARIAERTRIINTMRWRLHELGPDLQPKTLITLKAPRQLATRLAAEPAGVLTDLLLRTCTDLVALTGRINDLTKQITARITDLCPALLAIHGVGPIVAATIIAELGDPTRIHTSAALARLAGTAPIPVWTGNNTRHRLDRGGNRHLNAAIYTIAITQARSHPQAKALIAKHQPTKGKRGALRILKRHLTDVIHRALQTDFNTPKPQHNAA